MGSPFPLRHTPGAWRSVPSALRTVVHGENLASGGGTTHDPRLHAQRPCRYTHSPSTQTAPLFGDGGTSSTRAGGGGSGTGRRADDG